MQVWKSMGMKDRVTGHNPAAVLYTHQSYYKQKLNMPPEEEKL